jgi:hypothetical protein
LTSGDASTASSRVSTAVLLGRTVPLAVGLRHEPSIALWDGDELVCACGRCSAVGYGDVAEVR